jgi:heme exporter protein A
VVASQKPHRLDVSNLTVSRSEIAVFSNVSFSLQAGESLQIGGRNGAGKTTLLRAICGLSDYDTGDVLYNQESINSVDGNGQKPFCRELLYLGHGLGLKDKLTAEQNLDFYRQLRFSPDTQLIRRALTALGIGDYYDVPVEQLSAGQKRRVALSRLMTEPVALWVLDEPLVALDKQGQAWLVEQCNQHLSNDGILLITSHQPISGIHGLQELALS